MSQFNGLMKGKRGLIMGVANERSIAWGIAKAVHDQGAELAFTYQGDALKKRVEPLAKELGGHVVGHCDVTDGATIDAVFAEVEKLWGKLDFVVHCIAFSDKDELTGRYVETSEANFTKLQKSLTESSNYFRATVWVTIGTTDFTLYSLLARGGSGQVRPILRSIGTA